MLPTCTYLLSIFTFIFKWLRSSLTPVLVTNFFLLPIHSFYPHNISSFILYFPLLPTWNCYPHGIVTHCTCTISVATHLHLSSFNFYFHLLTTWNFAALIFLHFFTFHLLYTKNCYPHGIVTHLELLPTWNCFPIEIVTHL